MLGRLNTTIISSPKLGEVPVRAVGSVGFPNSERGHGAIIMGVTGGGHSALTGGAPVGRFIGCTERFFLSSLV